MGVLQRFERRLEGLVSGAFAKAFKADVQPVEIASALQRELDDRSAVMGKGVILVPNKFVVELSSHDHDRLAMYAGTLSQELAAVVREHAEEQHYQLRGDVDVSFQEAEDLDIGVHRIRSSVVSSVVSVNPPVEAPAPPRRAPKPPAPVAPVAPPVAIPVAAPAAAAAEEKPKPAHHAKSADVPAETTVLKPQAVPVPYLEVNGDRHPLSRPVTVLGRGTAVDLRIDDAGVSRQHAEIRLGPPAMLVDLNSTNGTLLDGAPVGEIELHDGAVISVGETDLTFRQPAE
ncbi:MAG: FhaA domain-containing protein [Sporichthyaceae bacterium]